jgi:hypothetical protein
MLGLGSSMDRNVSIRIERMRLVGTMWGSDGID